MLETDEVDDDYFTPVSSTSLANIFGGSTQREAVNDSLKYTPPKKHVPHNIYESKFEEDTKVTECIFACALAAYEWIDNNYLSKGKIGFAIVKITKTNSHNIVLYNSNKITLSSTPITSKLNLVVKGNNYICYYDVLYKYWSLNAKEDDIKKITDLLRSLSAEIKYEVIIDQNLPAPSNTDAEKASRLNKSDKESDTDSSVNKKTKLSILNRMASMGQSVLPTHNISLEKSSDSSDTAETISHAPKVTRHKPGKTIARRTNTEKNISENSDLIGTNVPVTMIEKPIATPTIYTVVNGQLMPISNASVFTNYGHNSNEMALFMNEQRMNNNELRININRTTDKVDLILDKMKVLEHTDKSKTDYHFQTEIMQKLLAEYENKIKIYEEALRTRQSDEQLSSSTAFASSTSSETESHKTISELQHTIKIKDKTILQLTEKLKESNLVTQIADLKMSAALKNEEFENISKNLEEFSKSNDDEKSNDFESKLKNTMNNVFRAISLNFENNETYSGETVKTLIAATLKKATMQTLSECNSDK